jgi:hypothetical protein
MDTLQEAAALLQSHAETGGNAPLRSRAQKTLERVTRHRQLLTAMTVDRSSNRYKRHGPRQHGGTTSRAMPLAATATTDRPASQRINDRRKRFSCPVARAERKPANPFGNARGQRDERQRDRRRKG